MSKIFRGHIGFMKGLVIGLIASAFSSGFLFLPIFWGGRQGAAFGALHDVANKYFCLLVAIQFIVFVGVPCAILLRKRHVRSVAGMLLVVIPVTAYLWVTLYATALGSSLGWK
jgi:hypothetical protein